MNSLVAQARGGEHYRTLEELADVLNAKLEFLVRATGVQLLTTLDAQGSLADRHAIRILLILENLTHNALKVTPRNRTVRVHFRAVEDGVCCEVVDAGPGLDRSLLPKLFTPCHSTHGGAGLGLAICKQLANQLGARLELKVNSPDGCVFALTVPANVFFHK